MDDASIIELFRQRDEMAISEIKQKYDKICFYIAGNILSQREDVEECVNSAYYEIWNSIPPNIPKDLKTYLPCGIIGEKGGVKQWCQQEAGTLYVL